MAPQREWASSPPATLDGEKYSYPVHLRFVAEYETWQAKVRPVMQGVLRELSGMH